VKLLMGLNKCHSVVNATPACVVLESRFMLPLSYMELCRHHSPSRKHDAKFSIHHTLIILPSFMKFVKIMYEYFIRLDFMPVPLSFCTCIEGFQGRRIRTPLATTSILVSCLSYGRCSFLPKRRLTFKGLQRVIFQNIELFITTTVLIPIHICLFSKTKTITQQISFIITQG
jgi:hypothetical protein